MPRRPAAAAGGALPGVMPSRRAGVRAPIARFAGLFVLLAAAPTAASGASSPTPDAIGHASCWLHAALRHGVNPHLLVAIAEVESGLRPGAVGRNRDGSVDLGLMQINSRWLPQLRRHGLDAADLMHPCVSVHVGAWVLAQAMRRHGNTWTAVGAYHAGPGPHRERYVQRVQQALTRRLARAAAQPARFTDEPAADYSAMSSVDADRVPGSGALDASR